jgi:hypothetical protein
MCIPVRPWWADSGVGCSAPGASCSCHTAQAPDRARSACVTDRLPDRQARALKTNDYIAGRSDRLRHLRSLSRQLTSRNHSGHPPDDHGDHSHPRMSSSPALGSRRRRTLGNSLRPCAPGQFRPYADASGFDRRFVRRQYARPGAFGTDAPSALLAGLRAARDRGVIVRGGRRLRCSPDGLIAVAPDWSTWRWSSASRR